jgi:hypothetical protein
MGGQFLPPPLFPGLLGPLEAAVGGRAGEGQTPDPDPAWGPPGRIPFHPREAPLPPPLLAGFMRGSPGILRNSMRAGPRSGPFRGLPLREGKLSRRWGTRPPGGGGVREPPFGALAPNEPPGTGAGSPHSEQGLPQDGRGGAMVWQT